MFHGYIQDARVYFGTTKYTEDFDVPHPYRPVGIESFRTSPHTPVNDYPCFNWMNNYSTSVSFGSGGNSVVTSTANLTVATDVLNLQKQENGIGNLKHQQFTTYGWYC